MTKLMNLNLQNAEILDKKAMKSIAGGAAMVCTTDSDCIFGHCIDGLCSGDGSGTCGA